MPDLNSVPASPRSLANSRRQSQQQLQQQAPANDSSSTSLNILPSNQSTVNPSSSSSVPSPLLNASQPTQIQNAADAGVGPGPGPTRHPRPLTASELHAQLEKEQEAVVNRLTRELSLLRAQQNASVVSNTSSTSASTPTHDSIPDTSLLSGSGFSIPTTRRHHRNSSSASQTGGGVQLTSTSYEARIHHPRPSQHSAVPLSRQSSSISRRSQNNSPAPSSSLDPSSYFHNQRIPAPTSVPASSVGATPGSFPSADQLSPGLLPATLRYEETIFYKNELETAKKENDALKRRIRELERQVRDRRDSDVSRSRSESASTTASINVPHPGGVSVAGPRDSSAAGHRIERERGMTVQSGVSSGEDVKVGESAAGLGVRGDDL